MPSLTLLADQDAQLINGGKGSGWWTGYSNGSGKGSGPSTFTSTFKSASTDVYQLNGANNFALGLGLHGSATAIATSSQANNAIVSTVVA